MTKVSFIGNEIKVQLKEEFRLMCSKSQKKVIFNEAEEEDEGEEEPMESDEELSSENEEGVDSEEESEDTKQLEKMFENLHLE